MNNEVRKFLKRAICFLLPFAFILLPFAFFLSYTGEVVNVKSVIREQIRGNDEYLLGLAYSEPKEYYKLNYIKTFNPDFIALGSSRVMQIRRFWFSGSHKFYNAGGAIDYIINLKEFLERLPDKQNLKTILLGIDPWWFNKKYDDLSQRTSHVAQYDNFTNRSMFINLRLFLKIFNDFIDGKINLKRILNKESNFIGISAIMKKNGYRNDGSYDYGTLNENMNDPSIKHDYHFKDTFNRIKTGTQKFETGDSINNVALNELDNFLSECKKRNIYVIGYIPPLANSVYNRLDSLRPKYGYLFSLEGTLAHVFRQYGFSFTSFLNPKELNFNDSDFIDGFHTTDFADITILLKIAESDGIMKKYLNEDYVKEELNFHRSENLSQVK
jgi:hypothetical protein